MASTCRRKKGTQTWHFCTNCADWPSSDYDERFTVPIEGELCNECRAKLREGNCR